MYASQRLVAAQLHAELELDHGETPDVRHLKDAVMVMNEDFPTASVPEAVTDLIRFLERPHDGGLGQS